MFKCTIQWFLAYSELVVRPSLPSILEHSLPPTKETHTWFKAPLLFWLRDQLLLEREMSLLLSFSFVIQFLPLQIPELGQGR